MEQITIGELAKWLGLIVSVAGTITAFVAGMKKVLTALFNEQLTEINKRFDKQAEAIKKIDLENCKNFLVSYLAKAESGEAVDEIERQRFWEEFEHYTEQGGNSYIRQKVDKLRNAGKL